MSASRRGGRAAAFAVALGAMLLASAAPVFAQARRDGAAPSRPDRKAAPSPRDREREAYWAGVLAGYRAARDRQAPLLGGPYGPAYGYPPSRYAPQPSYGVDYTYAPWAGGRP